jgi:hypothetical protein
MIPGLNLDHADEQRLWAAFQDWTEPFKARLRTEGVPGLLERYDKLISSVESQTCSHGPGATLRTGEAWQSCCGISYEYYNDIASRTALAIVLEFSRCAFSPQALDQLVALDERLHSLYPGGHSRGPGWWEQGLPAGVRE